MMDDSEAELCAALCINDIRQEMGLPGIETFKEVLDKEQMEKLLRCAFRHGLRFWMTTKDDPKFRGSLAACVLLLREDNKRQIEQSMKPIRALDMLLRSAKTGIALDMATMPTPDEHGMLDGVQCFPLLKWWREESAKESAR